QAAGLRLFESQCFRYVKPFVSVPLAVLLFVTTTSTVPLPCAGVVAVIFVELTTITLVAGVPPNDTVAPLRKPVPMMLPDVPPALGPVGGWIAVTVTGSTTLTLADWASEQPAPVVTVAWSVSAPADPAVKVMALVPLPAVIVPPLIDQAYVAPLPAE